MRIEERAIQAFFLKKVITIQSLLPVLKERKRYLLYQMDSTMNMVPQQDLIEHELRGFVGDLGLAKAGLRFISQKKNRGIIQVNHTSVDDIKTGLALIRKMNNSPVRITTIKVSGVVNKLNRVLS